MRTPIPAKKALHAPKWVKHHQIFPTRGEGRAFSALTEKSIRRQHAKIIDLLYASGVYEL